MKEETKEIVVLIAPLLLLIASLIAGTVIYRTIATSQTVEVEVVCQHTTTQTAVFIHASTTQTNIHASVVNETKKQIISEVSCYW